MPLSMRRRNRISKGILSLFACSLLAGGLTSCNSSGGNNGSQASLTLTPSAISLTAVLTSSARLRASPRESALNQIVRGEILSRQGHAEAACRTIAQATAELRAMGMHWHASQATAGLETSASLSPH